MSTSLATILGQWKDLSAKERENIEVASWEKVFECQACKQDLADEIRHLADDLGPEFDHEQRQIRQLVDDVIQLERENLALVESRKNEKEEERDQLNRSSRQLKNIKVAYANSEPMGASRFS